MRRLRRDGRGLSEIVGALMLIVIVVIAATALAAFVASEQKLAQKQAAANQQRALEDLRVLSVVPTANATGAVWSLEINVANLDVNPTTITEVWVDNLPLLQYQAYEYNTTLAQSSWVTIEDGGQLPLAGEQVMSLQVNDTPQSPGPGSFSFTGSGYQLSSKEYVEVSFFTSLTNVFTQTFVPPTAIAIVSTISVYSGGNYITEPLLDGSSSFQPANNGTIVSWSWTVGYALALGMSCLTPNPATYAGEKVVPDISCDAVYSIELVVQNSDGLIGVSDTTYNNP